MNLVCCLYVKMLKTNYLFISNLRIKKYREFLFLK